jgi:hypothetical protein
MAYIQAQPRPVSESKIVYSTASPTGDTFANGRGAREIRARNSTDTQKIVRLVQKRPCNLGAIHTPSEAFFIVEPNDESCYSPIPYEHYVDAEGKSQLLYEPDASGLTIAVLTF